MRHILLGLGIALFGTTASGQEALRPAASGRGSSEVRLAPPRTRDMEPSAGSAKVIKLDYGQPHLRGRALFTDSLVPYDKPWRLGANNATTLTTDVDLEIGGKTLSRGTYILYALPSRTLWKLIVQKSAGQSATEYSEANDVARIDLRRRELSSAIESLTMWLIPSLEPGVAHGELRIAWGNVELSAPWTVK